MPTHSQEQLLFPKSKSKQNKRMTEERKAMREDLPILTRWITGLHLGTGVFSAVQTGDSVTKTDQILSFISLHSSQLGNRVLEVP